MNKQFRKTHHARHTDAKDQEQRHLGDQRDIWELKLKGELSS